MTLITIDFETRSRAKLKTVSAYKYAEDESTTILCMAYNVTGNKADTKLWLPDQPFPQVLIDAIDEGQLFEAHNSFFEHCIWQLVGIPKFNFPQLPLDRWRCSAAKSRANGIPGSLEMGGAALNLDTQKDKKGKYLIRKLCEPRKPTKNNPEEWNNDPDLMDELGDYCVTDVGTEIELSHQLAAMSDKETQIWLLDQLINWRGIYIDVEAVKATISILDQAVIKYNKRIAELSEGAFTTSGQRDRIMEWCESHGVKLGGYTKADIDTVLKQKDLPANVKEVLQIRQILGKTSTAKYKKMLDQIAKNGRIHNVLVYHKAHTGRWGGSGIQVQNLPRPTIKDDPDNVIEVLKTGDLDEVDLCYDNPFEVAASAVRSMIAPAPGNKFISADYAAIEARMVFWFAEDEQALDIFRRGKCIYCEMASEIYGLTYEEVYIRYKNGDQEADKMRFMGKQAILGLGYQMGVNKFATSCANFGVPISEEFAQRVVTSYRSRFKSIVNLWAGLEKVAKQAVENPRQIFKYKKVKYRYDGKYFLKCKLPSGRVMCYPKVSYKLTETSWGEAKNAIHYYSNTNGKWVESTTYGGKLTENVVQAGARDIMAEAMLRLENRGYTVLMAVHDEAVSEVPDNFGSVEEYCDILCELPEWAKGLPLKAEGWRGYRYRK